MLEPDIAFIARWIDDGGPRPTRPQFPTDPAAISTSPRAVPPVSLDSVANKPGGRPHLGVPDQE